MSRTRKLRLLLLAMFLITSVVIAKATGLADQLRATDIQDQVAAAGAWGVLLFVTLFAIGELVHVPGMLFVAAAILMYGRVTGGVLGLVGGVVAVTVSFVLVRAVGGRALGEIDRPLMKTLLAQIDKRPIRAVILMRLVFLMLPLLNYALALTNIRLRDYLIGSTVGLVPVVVVAAVFFDWLFAVV